MRIAGGYIHRLPVPLPLNTGRHVDFRPSAVVKVNAMKIPRTLRRTSYPVVLPPSIERLHPFGRRHCIATRRRAVDAVDLRIFPFDGGKERACENKRIHLKFLM